MLFRSDQLVSASPRIVRKQWSSPDELAQELFAMFSAGGTTKSTKNNKVNVPTYPQVVKEPQTSYPKEISRNNYTINFADLKNPTTPTYPEVPPIPIEKKID